MDYEKRNKVIITGMFVSAILFILASLFGFINPSIDKW